MYSDTVFLKLVSVSRNIFWLSMMLMLNPFVLFISAGNLIRTIVIILFTIGALLMIVSWLIPGVFIIIKKPWYALAWTQGLSNKKSPIKWEQLQKRTKIALYFRSFLFLIFVIVGIILTALDLLKGR